MYFDKLVKLQAKTGIQISEWSDSPTNNGTMSCFRESFSQFFNDRLNLPNLTLRDFPLFLEKFVFGKTSAEKS